ncbi:LPS translocon maturation chaperone LptM [Oceanicoccus sagamiensis]|uniref:Lipoprotein n=1 Tax=Oceanicoccus sagamiensis TaxID=716816 RepID=A0A1X9N900_9GAMM|nr:lipoprotein [Oceanicoccus sagamiensis]ARN74146.1 hypothetical protein BST96_08445 [Oceanicoccus sagamiensis]
MTTTEVAALIRAALSITALVSSLLILTACGQKGPLYLPQDPSATSGDVSSETASAQTSDEKDKPKASEPTDSLD